MDMPSFTRVDVRITVKSELPEFFNLHIFDSPCSSEWTWEVFFKSFHIYMENLRRPPDEYIIQGNKGTATFFQKIWDLHRHYKGRKMTIYIRLREPGARPMNMSQRWRSVIASHMQQQHAAHIRNQAAREQRGDVVSVALAAAVSSTQDESSLNSSLANREERNQAARNRREATPAEENEAAVLMPPPQLAPSFVRPENLVIHQERRSNFSGGTAYQNPNAGRGPRMQPSVLLEEDSAMSQIDDDATERQLRSKIIREISLMTGEQLTSVRDQLSRFKTSLSYPRWAGKATNASWFLENTFLR